MSTCSASRALAESGDLVLRDLSGSSKVDHGSIVIVRGWGLDTATPQLNQLIGKVEVVA
ncbi:MAG: hypothetical protein M3Y57_21280 [Acidobacteriota bacterium]|nr:hypothetical protein [Acidobacteriota bacterium]